MVDGVCYYDIKKANKLSNILLTSISSRRNYSCICLGSRSGHGPLVSLFEHLEGWQGVGTLFTASFTPALGLVTVHPVLIPLTFHSRR